MPNRSEAYDFSLFENRMDNTAPVRQPRREERREQEHKIRRLPQKQLEKNARPQRHPVRLMAATAFFGLVMASVVSVVYSQVQLTELTESINAASTQLEEAKSLEIQMNMQASQKMNGTEVENYAVNELGMNKISGSQVSYVNVAQQDRGTVVRDVDGGSVLEQIWATVRSWFA